MIRSTLLFRWTTLTSRSDGSQNDAALPSIRMALTPGRDGSMAAASASSQCRGLLSTLLERPSRCGFCEQREDDGGDETYFDCDVFPCSLLCRLVVVFGRRPSVALSKGFLLSSSCS